MQGILLLSEAGKYAGGREASGRAKLFGHVKADGPDEECSKKLWGNIHHESGLRRIDYLPTGLENPFWCSYL